MLYVLGEGSHAVVWCALHDNSKKKVAIKIISKQKSRENDLNEIMFLEELEFKYIVEMFEWFQDDSNIFIVIEYLPNGSLQDLVKQMGYLEESIAKKYIYQLLLTVEYLHNFQVMHRDIKAENILLDINHDIRLVDFSMSVELGNSSSICGSPAYMAPEMISGNKYDERADVWSIGILLFYLIKGHFPFDEENNQKLFYKIIHTDCSYPETISDDSINLISRLLEKDPDHRITIREALHHDWFDQTPLSARISFKRYDHILPMINMLTESKKDVQEQDEVTSKILNKYSSLKADLSYESRIKSFTLERRAPAKLSTIRKRSYTVKVIRPTHNRLNLI